MTAVNDPPTTSSASFSGYIVGGGFPIGSVKYLWSDVDGGSDPLTFIVVSQFSHGTMFWVGDHEGLPMLHEAWFEGDMAHYTPNDVNFQGEDSLTFKVNDGNADSNVSTITLIIGQINDLPVAITQSVTTAEDTAVSITLTGTDQDGDTLTYTVVDQPSNGALSGTAPNLAYMPNTNYNGDDSFTFKVNDGTVDSEPATVSITVTAVNDPPVAPAQSVTTAEDTAVAITLVGTDADGDTLTYTVVDQPSNGTLTGTAPNLTYTPNADYNGDDSFTFRVNDGTVDSEPATVSITVTAVNDLPVANDQSVEVGQNMPQHPITLTANDADGDSLTYLLVSNPSNGQLSGTPPNLTYTPNADYDGADSFTFKVNDGTVDSEPATVSITVTAVNDAPVAQDILIDDWFQPGMSVGINLLSTAC